MFSFLQHVSEISKANNHIHICVKGMNFKKINNGEIIVLAVMQRQSKNLPVLFVRNDKVKIQNLFG